MRGRGLFALLRPVGEIGLLERRTGLFELIVQFVDDSLLLSDHGIKMVQQVVEECIAPFEVDYACFQIGIVHCGIISFEPGSQWGAPEIVRGSSAGVGVQALA